MRQQVNLFQDALRPQQVRWSAKQFSRAAIITFAGMFLFEGFGFFQTWMIKNDLAEAEASLKRKTEELKTAEVQYPRPKEDERLVSRVKQLDEELRQKQQILGLLSDDQYGNAHGFAEHLAGLSNQHVEGIWLTKLFIQQGGKQLGLSGGSTKPELVPQFIQRLGGEPSFAGKEFKTFTISRADKPSTWVNFDLSTETSGEKQE